MACVTYSKAGNDVWIAPDIVELTPKNLRTLVAQARFGLSLGLKPDLVLEGSGGTYFLHDARKNKIGVFKPADEEPYAENNPRGYLQQAGDTLSLRAGIVPGESCIRELAAYLLDPDGFSGVPMTTLVEARHPTFNNNGARLNVSQGGAAMGAHSILPLSPVKSLISNKLGSFQEFVRHECTIDDISPSKISTKEVHKIAILDIRIMNADRNAANLLVRHKPDDSLELVPIDHGYCLRSICDVSWMDWCWLDWPQIKEPLCEEHKKYIKNLDIEADVKLLQDRLNLCQEAVDYFRASSTLLKAGVAAGLTLYDIAILCCRNDNLAEEPSMMEKLFDMASELAHVAIENDRWHHSAASRAIMEQLVPRNYIVPSTNVATSRFSRSVSSVEMATLPSRPSDHSLNQDEALEPMAALSDSDSSSDIGDDCNDWAAELIADLTEHQISPQGRTSRSMSIASDESSSDGNLSNTGKGFWVVAPGSEQAKALDNDSVQWTPKLSPRKPAVRLEMESLELDVPFNNDSMKNINVTPTVKFTDKFRFIPPATVSVIAKSDVDSDTQKSHGGSTSGLLRSKSYSSLPINARSASSGQHRTISISTQNANIEDSVEYSQYRKYFNNFIDLVIARETMNALHNSKNASTK